ncbi:MAG TPA: thioredoxin family protein [Candidatus Faecisoma merdavium]|nr:thioredoxin family protein [Candidatus Faecisoma merdavium]
MKKILIILCALFLVGCSNPKYTEISVTQFQEKLDAKESFILVIGSDTCSACKSYEPTMQKVMKDTNLEIFYINLHVLSDEDYSKIYSSYVVTSTPTTLFFKDGVETSTYDRIVGAVDYDEVIKKLEKLGYIGG